MSAHILLLRLKEAELARVLSKDHTKKSQGRTVSENFLINTGCWWHRRKGGSLNKHFRRPVLMILEKGEQHRPTWRQCSSENERLKCNWTDDSLHYLCACYPTPSLSLVLNSRCLEERTVTTSVSISHWAVDTHHTWVWPLFPFWQNFIIQVWKLFKPITAFVARGLI